MTKQLTARQINNHLNSGDSRYARVFTVLGAYRFRITRARTRGGVLEGRVCEFNAPRIWEPIAPVDTVQLSYY